MKRISLPNLSQASQSSHKFKLRDPLRTCFGLLSFALHAWVKSRGNKKKIGTNEIGQLINDFQFLALLIHISRVWRPLDGSSRKWVRGGNKNAKRIMLSCGVVRSMRSISVSKKKTQKYEIKARNETTAHNTQYWQLKICFRIKRNEKKNSRGARKLCFGFVLCKREGNGHLVMLLQ